MPPANEQQTIVDWAKVRKFREELERTQDECAIIANVTRFKWSDFEAGRVPDPQISTVANIAKAVKKNIQDILLKRTTKA